MKIIIFLISTGLFSLTSWGQSFNEEMEGSLMIHETAKAIARSRSTHR